jgi:hypothetical protein
VICLSREVLKAVLAADLPDATSLCGPSEQR